MKKLALSALLTGAALAWTVPLEASADSTCYPSWKVASREFSCAGRAALSPGNDTRINLFLLQRETTRQSMAGLAYPALGYDSWDFGRTFVDWGQIAAAYIPPVPEGEESYDGYSGSRCDSFDLATPGFLAAMAANRKLSAGEREGLAKFREGIGHDCADGPSNNNPATGSSSEVFEMLSSGPGKDYAAYLGGASAFYAGQWDDARSAFSGLTASSDPWLAETSSYMLARVDLNAAIVRAFDEWGSFEGTKAVDQAAASRAREALGAYLKAYPKGLYAGSATGLLRRAYWLSGDRTALSSEYARLLLAPGAGPEATIDLIQEIDNKLLMQDGAVNGPLLLAASDLLRMRGDEYSTLPALTHAELAAQKPAFAGQEDLYDFLLASHAYYVSGDMKAVLQLIPDAARAKDQSPLSFSRQVLRGQALAAMKDRNEGGFWQELLGGATGLWQRPLAELGLAMNWERSGKLAQVFAAASPVTDPTLRRILIDHSAGPELLRRQAADRAVPADERKAALNALLYKQLSRGFYRGFHGDLAMAKEWPAPVADPDSYVPGYAPAPDQFVSGPVSDGFACPELRATAMTLAANPRDAGARLCLGDFWRLNGFDLFGAYDAAPEKDELGGFAADFPGVPIARGTFYPAIIADPKAGADNRAYALYRAIRCYAPGGNNSCGGTDYPVEQRRAWFQQLKREYPRSRWASELKFYW